MGLAGFSALLATTLCVVTPSLAQVAPPPEAATGRAAKALGTARTHMIAAANPLAAEAGREILRAGGNAADAAVAIQLVLGLVEPQSSGLGGGAFIVFHEARSGRLTTLDGRETAPAAARPNRFVGPDGKPLKFYDAVLSGLSVGVPGTVAVLEAAHKKWGKLPWSRLFLTATRLAEDGFSVSPRLNGLLTNEKYLSANPRAKAYFYDADGKPRAVGAVLKNPAYAETLKTIAQQGAAGFYSGSIAADIIATASAAALPSDMTAADLTAYKVVEREPVCGSYRAMKVCGMGPPSSGAVALGQILGMLETHDLARLGPSAAAAHLIAEAGRLAYADRALYLADADFLSVPVAGLLDEAYLKGRAALIAEKSAGPAKAGVPPMKKTWHHAGSDSIENGTSHISIIDGEGNALSMTTTIEDGFGARLMTAGGFLLNNELTDFNFAPTAEDGTPVANRVEAGKRPRSSMSPTIVLDGGNKVRIVVGSPGGSAIINYVAKTLIALVDWKLDPQQAVDFGNFGSRNGPTELEAGSEAAKWKDALEALGHKVNVAEMTSGTQAILVTPQGLLGGADSRREGVAIGD